MPVPDLVPMVRGQIPVIAWNALSAWDKLDLAEACCGQIYVAECDVFLDFAAECYSEYVRDRLDDKRPLPFLSVQQYKGAA